VGQLRQTEASEVGQNQRLTAEVERLKKVEAEKPDLVVLDVVLPGKSGFGVCTDIKVFSGQRFLPVILLTGQQDLSSKVTGLNGGADDYLTKPFAFQELVARIRALLRRQTEAKLPVFNRGRR
jgi:DNA-binding response OmpR family regulator